MLQNAIADRSARVGVIGLGYIGLPLSTAVAHAGFQTVGFEVDAAKRAAFDEGRPYVEGVKPDRLRKLVATGRLRATAAFAELSRCDVIIVCVPTPLTRNLTPDLSLVENAAQTIAQHLRPAQLIVLESTSYPGTTIEVVKPILQTSGLKAGVEFFLGFSPEREDPGNPSYDTVTIPKIVSGDGRAAQELIEAFYRAFVDRVVPVSSPTTAEAVKMTENIFRAVNVALVNELKIIYAAMGVDIWEVVEAAATKPFGYMPFYPGPGVGGHCIAVDPYYLAWKSKAYDRSARFIELAGEINLAMPRYVVDRLGDALARRASLALNAARILILGVAYKKNIADVRESAALKIMRLLRLRGAMSDFHDPHVASIPSLHEHPEFAAHRSEPLSAERIRSYDAILLVTDHDALDYRLVADHARLIIDTRNAFAQRKISADHIVKA